MVRVLGPAKIGARKATTSEPIMGEVVNAQRVFHERRWRQRWQDYLDGSVCIGDMIRETQSDPHFADYCRERMAEARRRREREADDGA